MEGQEEKGEKKNINSSILGAREKAAQLRACTALSED